MNEANEVGLDLQKIEEKVKAHPRLRGWISELLLFDRVGSTNQVAKEMGSAGIPSGVLILAEMQDAGQGRLGRTWISPKGVNLYLSLLIQPHQPIREFPLFSLAAAVALAHAIRSNTGLPAVVKWPNDILLEEKKVAGILLETATASGGGSPYLVIGMGVNVNWRDIPAELPQATSLNIAAGHLIDRNQLVFDILIALWEQCHLLETEGAEALITALSEVCVTLGKLVRVETQKQVFEGVAEAIVNDGGLLLSMPNGVSRKILLGDITHLTAISPKKRHKVIGH